MAPQDVHQHNVQSDCPPSLPRATTNLCIENCGFYGTLENGGRCSACFKKFSMSKGALSSRPVPDSDGTCSPSSSSRSLITSRLTLDAAPVGAAEYEEPPLSPRTFKLKTSDANCDELPFSPLFLTSTDSDAECFEFPCGSLPSKASVSDAKPNRCYSCRRRVGLTGFKCRCGNIFCSVHRYSEEHNCTFDYKAKAKKEIAANNPVVKAPKINRI
ncbi:hypothetical protein KP509_14G061000 [Ceratopteris richardii]|uniref:Uncharacterized protein n=1 Tax=Ceratopteris richardii TaxID=49495 RepID=A0A8T2TA10_CERRI|nr:hypothetical protein KP509_14G061000 [Ceratopteris richardii]